ncbi:hypothetical protein FJZ31_19800 [Candidatus Poribacteria bacterium]|nr:hypothetical protein [Candidatus Poribacteria bacterium]
MQSESLNIGMQLQLFLDDWLIETMKNLALKLHSPQPREIVIRADRPYETPTLYDPVVIKDGEFYRLWYRTNFDAPPYYTGYAESSDGICWTKPSLNLIEHNGSTDNNLLWQAGEDDGYVLSIFKDGNPKASDTERYKAIAVSKRGMVGLVSPDGIQWKYLQQEPIIVGPEGDEAFDSHNIAFWDSVHGHYVAYLRGWRGGIRRIRRGISSDFRHWSELEYLDLSDSPPEHLYKNAATPYYRRPDIYLMFPKRFLPERKFDPDHSFSGLSDIVFMFSRDGLRWDRQFMEGFIRPGRDWKNWHERAIEVGSGLVPTGDGEMSLYMVANYRTPSVHIRRMALREDGFVSVHAQYAGGEMVTKLLTFEGHELVINYSTSAAGSIRVEIQDVKGKPIPSFTLAESAEIYGDELERVVAWNGNSDVSLLAGKLIHLRFVLKDADLYSICFR